jgi:NADPH-dependent 2,4-dienoyl-CoA reductase/sulfur reductase-like enzyme
MITSHVDVAIIGGGPAGLAAAISARYHGANYVVIIDRNNWIGGILPQCIHDGFGVEETGMSMTGPEYCDIYVKTAEKLNVSFILETMVLSINKNLELITVNSNGLTKIIAKSIVLAMGCREKTRWNALIPGDRPSGIYTAGVAQAFINLYNIIPGKNVLLLGSGDVGLIMARRLKFEGANVLGVVEIMPHPSGLSRNIVQCLDDYDIPLFLNHTITNIKGRERLESVTIAEFDNKNKKIIPNSEREFKCDTLLLSLGLIPENELSKEIGIEIDKNTNGPIVNQDFETNISGIFCCGNCLQVYDTVDVLSKAAKFAGKAAAKYAKDKKSLVSDLIFVSPGNDVSYVVPQKITQGGLVNFSLRCKKIKHLANLKVFADEKEIENKKLKYINPANMIEFELDISDKLLKSTKNLVVELD